MSTSLKPLAQVRDMTGKVVHLGMFESVIGLRTENLANKKRMTLGINRAKVRETHATYQITKRGMTLYVFESNDQGWALVNTVTEWWSTDELVRRLPAIEPV